MRKSIFLASCNCRRYNIYKSNDSIDYMPGVGTMAYKNTNKPYAITELTTESTAVPVREQEVSYTSFMRPGSITENDVNAAFTYNVAGERVKMSVTQNGAPILTRYYISGQYETDVQTNTERLYLGGDPYTSPAVYVKEAGVWKLYYICSDHLGSITHVANSDGTLKQELSYDAWGRLRDPATRVAYAPGTEPALFLGRGYTGHEYLPWFGLINMNARLYDPALGRFLSPDPYVQVPDFTQSYNRYSYCINNPLIYSDPTGEKWWRWLLAAVGLSEPVSTLSFVTSTITTSYLTAEFNLAHIGPLVHSVDYTVSGTKSVINSIKDVFNPQGHAYEDDSWIFEDLWNSIKIDAGLSLALPWECEQTIFGNSISHFRNLTGHVDNVEVKNWTLLVNDDTNDPTDIGGMTLGPYINSKNFTINDDIYAHELGHTIQSRILGPLYLTKIAIPSGISGYYSFYYKKDFGDYHNNTWYEVWASRLGGAPNHEKDYKKNNFWYWWWIITLPSFPN